MKKISVATVVTILIGLSSAAALAKPRRATDPVPPPISGPDHRGPIDPVPPPVPPPPDSGN